MMTDGSIPNSKAIASLLLLVIWKIWNGRDACVFRNKHASPYVMLDII
jgi:hypothetical protein